MRALTLKYLEKKGVFPFSYFDDISKLRETKLHSKAQFSDKLSNDAISDSEYSRAEHAWNVFECCTLQDYATIYLISDCLIFTDFFESFRTLCLNQYKLDPAQYHTSPSLSWDAMMETTRVNLELLTDIDMIHFLKDNVRGGVCYCSVRQSEANNPLFSNYDCSKPTSYIMYSEAKNLYVNSMSQSLPIKDFAWMSGRNQ